MTKPCARRCLIASNASASPTRPSSPLVPLTPSSRVQFAMRCPRFFAQARIECSCTSSPRPSSTCFGQSRLAGTPLGSLSGTTLSPGCQFHRSWFRASGYCGAVGRSNERSGLTVNDQMPDNDFPSRFRTHAHYVAAFAWLAAFRGATSPAQSLAATRRRVDASGVLNDTADAPVPEDEVRTRLTNALGTELLLALAGQWDNEDEFVRITNTWGVVQAYYVGYRATQALAIAKGFSRPTNHPRTRNHYADFWLNRPVELPPWSFGMRGEQQPCNLPTGASLDPTVHAWQTIGPATCWSVAAKALSSTRNEALKGAHMGTAPAGPSITSCACLERLAAVAEAA